MPLEFVTFTAAGKAFEAAKANTVDVLFVAIEPVRAAEVEFTPPYVLIEGAYLVLKDSPLREPADVDQPGKRISVGENSAYDLYLTRTLKHASLLRTAGGCCKNIDLFRAEKLDAAAGVRQPLAAYAKDHPDVRVMEKGFQEIRQAMGTPKGRARRRRLSAHIRRRDEGERLCCRRIETQQSGRRSSRARRRMM